MSMLTYEALKYSGNKFINSGDHFSQIVLSDTNATKVSFKFTNTGTADLMVLASGSGDDEVRVNAGASQVITFESDPADSGSQALGCFFNPVLTSPCDNDK
jgi:hypothetical protein